jgi:hypothetical protein
MVRLVLTQRQITARICDSGPNFFEELFLVTVRGPVLQMASVCVLRLSIQKAFKETMQIDLRPEKAVDSSSESESRAAHPIPIG